jgi:hypothetical protein
VKVEDIPFEHYVRKPFTVEAIQITDENIEELAPFIGALEKQENGRWVIIVDRKLIRNLDKVYSGYWLTKMGTTLRCYSQNAFAKHFVVDPTDADLGLDPHDHTQAMVDTWPTVNPYVAEANMPPLVTWNVSTQITNPPDEDPPLISQDIFE